jgi:hypothetical protein
MGRKKLHDDKGTLTTEQLAERWGMSAKYLANHRKRVTPPFFRPTGGKRGAVRYRIEDVRAYERRSRE